MYIPKLDGEVDARNWEEYQRSVVRDTDDPDVVIGLGPGAWRQYLRQFFQGAEEAGPVIYQSPGFPFD